MGFVRNAVSVLASAFVVLATVCAPTTAFAVSPNSSSADSSTPPPSQSEPIIKPDQESNKAASEAAKPAAPTPAIIPTPSQPSTNNATPQAKTPVPAPQEETPVPQASCTPVDETTWTGAGHGGTNSSTIVWSMDSQCALTVTSGTLDYEPSYTVFPWYENGINTQVRSINVESLTLVGNGGSFEYTFSNLPNLETFQANDIFIHSNMIRTFYTFQNDTSLKTLTLPNWKLTNNNFSMCRMMINSAPALETLNIPNWDASQTSTLINYTDPSYGGNIFPPNVKTINAPGWDISSVTSLHRIFYNNSTITDIDLSNWKTTSLGSLDQAINTCPKLESLNLSGWNTSSLLSLHYAIAAAPLLTTINLTGWDTSNVTDMIGLFYGCSNLANLDLSNWDVGKASFYNPGLGYAVDFLINCNNLTTLNVSGWKTGNQTNLRDLFSGHPALTTINLSGWNAPKLTILSNFLANDPKLTTVIMDTPWTTAGTLTTMDSMFSGDAALQALPDLSTITTAQNVSMSSMFKGCKGLTTAALDFTKLPTISKVSNMSSMFQNDTGLVGTLNLDGLDIGSATSMNSMFAGCTGLTGFHAANWNPSKITDMGSMFSGDTLLKTMELPNWTVANNGIVSPIHAMLASASNLQTLNAPDWNFNVASSPVTNMNGLLGNLSTLKNINAPRWDISKVTQLNTMFDNGNSGARPNNPVNVDLRDWKTDSLTTVEYMFRWCDQVQTINLANWNVTHIGSIRYTFQDNHNLTSLDLTGWKPSSAALDIGGTFSGCSKLNSLDLSGWNTSKAFDTANMFGFTNIKRLRLGAGTTNLDSAIRAGAFPFSRSQTVYKEGTSQATTLTDGSTTRDMTHFNPAVSTPANVYTVSSPTWFGTPDRMLHFAHADGAKGDYPDPCVNWDGEGTCTIPTISNLQSGMRLTSWQDTTTNPLTTYTPGQSVAIPQSETVTPQVEHDTVSSLPFTGDDLIFWKRLAMLLGVVLLLCGISIVMRKHNVASR